MYNFSRVLPHAILSVILLDKGFSISQISLIQSIFMIAALIMEIPSGVVSDIISEKNMYQLSLILIFISYFLIFMTKSFFLISVAWFLYGMSSAGMTGSLDTYFIKTIKNKNGSIKKFNVKNNYSILFSGLIGGGLGATIYNYIGINIYIVSLIGFILAFVLIQVLIPKANIKMEDRITFGQMVRGLKSLKNNSRLSVIILLMCFLQMFTQVFYQYWQFILLQDHISKAYFGIVYVLFQVFSILGNMLLKYIKISKISYIINLIFIFVLFGLCNIFKVNFMPVLFLALLQIPFNIYSYQINIEFQHNVNSKMMSTFISIMEFLSMIVAALTLWFIAAFVSSNNLMVVLNIVVLVFFIFSMVINIFRKNEKIQNE